MAEILYKSETATPTTRCYTVGCGCDAKYQPVPAVTLKGHWLKEMGFDTGTELEVKVLTSCQILTAKEPREIAAFIELVTSQQK